MASSIFDRVEAMAEDRHIEIQVIGKAMLRLTTEEALKFTKRTRRHVSFIVRDFEMLMETYEQIENCMYLISQHGSAVGANNKPHWTHTELLIQTPAFTQQIVAFLRNSVETGPYNFQYVLVSALMDILKDKWQVALNKIAVHSRKSVFVHMSYLKELKDPSKLALQHPFRTEILFVTLALPLSLASLYSYLAYYFPEITYLYVCDKESPPDGNDWIERSVDRAERFFTRLSINDKKSANFTRRPLEERQEGHTGPLKINQFHPHGFLKKLVLCGEYKWKFRHLVNYFAGPKVDIILSSPKSTPRSERLKSVFRFILHASKLPIELNANFALGFLSIIEVPDIPEPGFLITSSVQIASLFFKMIVRCGAFGVHWRRSFFFGKKPPADWLELQRQRILSTGTIVLPVFAPRVATRSSIKADGGLDIAHNLDKMLNGGEGLARRVVPFPYHSPEERNAFFGFVEAEDNISPEFDLPSDAEIMGPDFTKW